MSALNLPSVYHITVYGKDFLATFEKLVWFEVGGDRSWADRSVRDHGVMVPAGPVDRLVQLPIVNTPQQVPGGEWYVEGRHIHHDDVQQVVADAAREHAWAIAVARAIEAEAQASKPTARERLLARLDQRTEDGYEWLEWPIADLRAALEATA